MEIVETPTGAVWHGRKDMENLAKLAYSRKSFKQLTHVFATDTEACAEYLTMVNTGGEVTDFEKEQGLHGVDVSGAKPTIDTLNLPICFVCEIKDGKIVKAREYWNAASLTQQLGTDEVAQPAAVSAPNDLTPKMIMEEKVPANLKNASTKLSDLSGVCQFDIAGPKGGQWYLDLTVPGGQVTQGVNPAATATISMTDEDFVAFFSGQLSAQKAFITGKLKLKGDMAMAAGLREILK